MALGVTSVRYADGKTVTYRDLSDMRATLALIEREIAESAGAVRLPRGLYPSVASGVR